MLASKARLLLAFIVIIALSPSTLVSPASGQKITGTTWAHTFGSISGPNSLEVTSDQGFVMLVHESPGSGVRVMKANLAGEVQWDRYYLPPGYLSASAGSVKQTRDGGYIVAGGAELRLPYPQIYGPSYGWLLKLDDTGNVQWSKTFQGAEEGFSQAEQTKDGGYVAVGNIGLPPGHASNGWVVKLDLAGNIVWQEGFVGQDIYSVDQTHDGGFVVAGTVGVDNKAEAWVLKLDPVGNIVWQKAYDSAPRTEAYAIQQTRDGGYVVIGEAITYDRFGDSGSSKALILKLDRKGNVEWQRLLDGGGFARPFSVEEISGGAFMVAGRFLPLSLVAEIRGPFLWKLDAKGNTIFQKVYGELNDFFFDVKEDREGGIMVAGQLFAYGSAWVLRLDTAGEIRGCSIGSLSNGSIADGPPAINQPGIVSENTNTTPVPTPVTAGEVRAHYETVCLSEPRKSTESRQG